MGLLVTFVVLFNVPSKHAGQQILSVMIILLLLFVCLFVLFCFVFCRVYAVSNWYYSVFQHDAVGVVVVVYF